MEPQQQQEQQELCRQQQQQEQQQQASSSSNTKPSCSSTDALPAAAANEEGARKPTEWWVRVHLKDLLHLLPCCCNPSNQQQQQQQQQQRKERSGETEEEKKKLIKCKNDKLWHLRFIERAVQTAGGEAKAREEEILYRMEEPEAICLFALFYLFPSHARPQSRQQQQQQQQQRSAAAAREGADADRVFTSLSAAPSWAKKEIKNINENLKLALPQLAALKYCLREQQQQQQQEEN
ncbi:hypothetical protein, conserved [Eimeria tenella]|uniref:Uncharacterized protein n=1 Tax=Eimeria tenella TaxID=5802 RepID=U6L0K2_EIMTE|nr:hypothetical protein, conserved [Eimeria tenella]CDJ41295.1 hypothetical protein, conserved [Eimeria tenella]|eukprot:XP_013232045.1 hypothetical protein, conserved [Eimeria tenella]